MMGSMGSVVGEGDAAYRTRDAGGRARYFPLRAAPERRKNFLADANGQDRGRLRRHYGAACFIGVLTNLTTGGVAASFASLGDIIIAEKGRTGFGGSRVIKQTIGEELRMIFRRRNFN